MYSIDFCTDASRDVPMQEYLDSLTTKMRAKTFRSMQLLREFGPELRAPNTKPFEDGIFELRTSQESIAGRCLFFFYDGDVIVLTHGFLKKTQKTLRKEIDRAKQYRRVYMEAKLAP